MRAILGTLTVEEVYKDREQFAALVRDVASPDVGKMGVEILSFTIKDVHDDVDYLESLGKSQTASVKRDAEIGVAQVRKYCNILKSIFFTKEFDCPFDYTKEKSYKKYSRLSVMLELKKLSVNEKQWIKSIDQTPKLKVILEIYNLKRLRSTSKIIMMTFNVCDLRNLYENIQRTTFYTRIYFSKILQRSKCSIS